MTMQNTLFNTEASYRSLVVTSNGSEFQRIQNSQPSEKLLEGFSTAHQGQSARNLISSIILLAIDDLAYYLRPNGHRDFAGEAFTNFVCALNFLFNDAKEKGATFHAYCALLELESSKVRYSLLEKHPELPTYIAQFASANKTH